MVVSITINIIIHSAIVVVVVGQHEVVAAYHEGVVEVSWPSLLAEELDIFTTIIISLIYVALLHVLVVEVEGSLYLILMVVTPTI